MDISTMPTRIALTNALPNYYNNELKSYGNPRAALFHILRATLKHNDVIRTDQEKRVANKQKALEQSQTYNKHISDILNDAVNLGEYSPNYEQIERYFLQSQLPLIQWDNARQCFQNDFYEALGEKKQRDKESFLRMCNVTGFTTRAPWNREKFIYQDALLSALQRDLVRGLQDALNAQWLPIDLLKLDNPRVEEYVPEANPFVVQKLLWWIWQSRARKFHSKNRSYETRITINPLILLEDFEFKKLFFAQRWHSQNKETTEIPLTETVFTSTNGHLNWPTLL